MSEREYNFTEFEQKWQKYWLENKTFRAEDNSPKGESVITTSTFLAQRLMRKYCLPKI